MSSEKVLAISKAFYEKLNAKGVATAEEALLLDLLSHLRGYHEQLEHITLLKQVAVSENERVNVVRSESIREAEQLVEKFKQKLTPTNRQILTEFLISQNANIPLP